MGSGASKSGKPEQFNSLPILTVSQVVAQGNSIDGKRVQIVGIVGCLERKLVTPFGGIECAAAEVVGRVIRAMHDSDKSGEYGDFSKTKTPACVRSNQAVAFALCDGDAEVMITVPDEPNSKLLHVWCKSGFKVDGLRCDPTRTKILLGAGWHEDAKADAKGNSAYCKVKGGREAPENAAVFWDAANKRGPVRDPVKCFNQWSSSLGGVNVGADFTRKRSVNEMVLLEGICLRRHRRGFLPRGRAA